MTELSRAEARRIALAAQGFAAPRSGDVCMEDVDAAVRRLGVLQIDSVNVLARAHYLPLFARLSAYDTSLLDSLAHEHRRLFEYWGHMASFLPMELYPLFRHRMAHMARRERVRAWARQHPGYLESVLAQVRERGPIAASDLDDPGQRTGPWWGHAKGKIALDILFAAGEVAVADRRNFTRYYDIPERVIPAEVLALPAPGPVDAARELIRLAASALGVATVHDLADYYRLPVAAARAAVAELSAAGEIEPVTVEGWRERAFLARNGDMAGPVHACALVGPFDNLVWDRGRTERLFGMHYRIEIYVPEPQRRYGYYVFPFLLGEELVALVALKADRSASVLRVRASHAEPGVDREHVARALAGELHRMSAWLGLGRVAVGPRGNLARALRGAMRMAGETVVPLP